MNELQTFNFNNNPVRTFIVESEPWFCLKDVCVIFGISNITMLKQRLNPKGLSRAEVLTKGGMQRVITINEPNLYKVVFRSDKPIAQEFENWICEKVLPSIRKTGSYTLSDKPVEVKEHTRKLPRGKKEIVLSAKAKEEVGGITKAVVTKALDEKLPHYLKQMKEFEKNAISDAFCQAADEIRQAKQSELKAYQLSDYEADIIEKIRSANAFNMLRLFMGVNKKLSPR